MSDLSHVPLSDEELAEARGFQTVTGFEASDGVYSSAAHTTAAQTLIERLLATLESRDQRISHLEEAADIVLKAAPFGDGAWLSALSILMDARADRQANPVALSEEEE